MPDMKMMDRVAQQAIAGQDVKIQDMKMQDQVTEHEIAELHFKHHGLSKEETATLVSVPVAQTDLLRWLPTALYVVLTFIW